MRLTLKFLAPYVAVGVFWCVFSNGWLAILAYHAQIVLWSRGARSSLHRPPRSRMFWLSLPAVFAGPLLYYALPYLARADLSAWLNGHQLSRASLLLMIPYLGLVHPFLEQLHWGPLRERTPLAHPLFAGYHVLVLCSLLTPAGLVLCFAVLVAASFLWGRMAASTGSLAVPMSSHILADLGVVVVAWLRT